jgi:hypothetical protein
VADVFAVVPQQAVALLSQARTRPMQHLRTREGSLGRRFDTDEMPLRECLKHGLNDPTPSSLCHAATKMNDFTTANVNAVMQIPSSPGRYMSPDRKQGAVWVAVRC